MNTAGETESATPESQPSLRRDPGLFGELIRFALIALLIVVPIRVFVAQPYIVSGASMHPTFENGDYLIVDQVSYRLREPARGEVVIFRYPEDPSKYFIKRIIGLPGETLTSDGASLTATSEEMSESIVLDADYVNEETLGRFSVSLGADEYFVLGDNRNASLDSRTFGPLEGGFIVGRPFVRLLPPNTLGYLPGDITQE